MTPGRTCGSPPPTPPYPYPYSWHTATMHGNLVFLFPRDRGGMAKVDLDTGEVVMLEEGPDYRVGATVTETEDYTDPVLLAVLLPIDSIPITAMPRWVSAVRVSMPRLIFNLQLIVQQ